MFCRKCGNEISDDVDFCSKCGFPAIETGKNSFQYPKKNESNLNGIIGGFVIVLGVIVCFCLFGKAGSKDNNSSSVGSDISSEESVTEGLETTSNTTQSSGSSPTVVNNDQTDGSTSNTKISYQKVDFSTLISDLNTNALRAEQTYQDQYVEIYGYLDVIDSDGAYFSIVEDKNNWSLIDIQCHISSDAILNSIMKLNKGDYISVKGQITNIGEILGYYIVVDDVKLVTSTNISTSNTNNSTTIASNTSSTSNDIEYYDWDSQTSYSTNISGDNFVGSWYEAGNEQSGLEIIYYPDDNLYSIEFWTVSLYVDAGGTVRQEYMTDGPYFASLDDANTMSTVGTGEVFISDGTNLLYVLCGTSYVRY